LNVSLIFCEKYPRSVLDTKLGVYFSVGATTIKHAHRGALVSGHLDQAEFHHLKKNQGGATSGIVFADDHTIDGL
jgi:hypothetical protein